MGFCRNIFGFVAVFVLLWGVECSRTYIVRVDIDSKPSIFPSHEHWYMAKVAAVKGLITDEKNLAAVKGDILIHVYKTVFHGFSAKLTPEQAEKLDTSHGVLAVLPDRVRQLHTTRSPQFLGLRPSGGLWPESDYGSDLVVGLLDTGIWPERKSFSDHGLGPVPRNWKGECEEGSGFSKNLCNKKLVGARFFPKGYEAMVGAMNTSRESRSPRDTDGHGSHTASIATGRHVYKANMLGYASGIAKGMAPKARLATYKVCWQSGCFDSDILSAFDRAIEDGVDVISLSVGGGIVPYYLDSIAMGAFGAMEKGVFVATSAGNDGPGGLSVSNLSPWVTTVGAGHEYRLADGISKPSSLASRKGSLRLDDWVLCRIYKKSRHPPRMEESEKDESHVEEGSSSLLDIHHDQHLQLPKCGPFSSLLASAVDVLDESLIDVESSQETGYQGNPLFPSNRRNDNISNNNNGDNGPAKFNTLHPQAFHQEKLLGTMGDFRQIYQSHFP